MEKVWLITGCSTGFGRELALQVLAKGYKVAVASRKTSDVDDIVAAYPNTSIAIQLDVTIDSEIKASVAQTMAKFGQIDVLVNNAGVGVFTNLEDMSVEVFDEQIAVNLRGVFLCTKAVLPSMVERQRGMIITINSIASITAFSGCTAYGASKAGALALTRSLRSEVRDRGIKVTDILVGATETNIWSEENRVTLGERMMQSDDVAGAVQMIVDSFENPRTHFEEIVIRPQRGDL